MFFILKGKSYFVQVLASICLAWEAATNRDLNSKGKNYDNDTHKVTGHRFESRIIYNSNKNSMQSTNWRLDFYKCNNVTYAQVLKKGIKNKAVSKDQSHGHSIQTTDQVPNKVTSTFIQQNKVMNKISHTDKTNHRCNSSGYSKPQSKVRKLIADSSHVQCANRFALLSVDAVVSKTNSLNNACPKSAVDFLPAPPARSTNNNVTRSCAASKCDAIVQGPVAASHAKQIEARTCTKYDLPLRIKNKSFSYKQVLPSCPTLQLWEAQNKYKHYTVILA